MEFDNPASGGLVFFEGRVRNHNDGNSVKSLEYQCYHSMAHKEGEKIIQEAYKNFEIHCAKCIHRYGHLQILDVAVWIGVSSSHRQEAFQACRFIIDQVKTLVSYLEKKNITSTKKTSMGCMSSFMSEQIYYSRQTLLNEIGSKGQKRLKEKKILIIGAGGLGHPCALYLASAGIGEIGITDFDRVEMSNLNRQIMFTVQDIGKYKADILVEKIKRQNPYIRVTSLLKKITPENIFQIMQPYDMILDCTDNLPVKFLLHDFSWLLSKRFCSSIDLPIRRANSKFSLLSQQKTWMFALSLV